MTIARIYKITAPNGMYYIGSTTTKLNKRVAVHRYRFKSDRALKELKEHFHFSDLKIDQIEECPIQKRYERENYWITNTKGYCINKIKAGPGMPGLKLSEERKESARVRMRGLWQTRREEMLKGVLSHQTKEFRSKNSALAAKSRVSKQPFFTVVNKKTGMIVGRFQTVVAAAKAIGREKAYVANCKRGMYVDSTYEYVMD